MENTMSPETNAMTDSADGIKEMLSSAGYSGKAIKYYLEKPLTLT